MNDRSYGTCYHYVCWQSHGVLARASGGAFNAGMTVSTLRVPQGVFWLLCRGETSICNKLLVHHILYAVILSHIVWKIVSALIMSDLVLRKPYSASKICWVKNNSTGARDSHWMKCSQCICAVTLNIAFLHSAIVMGWKYPQIKLCRCEIHSLVPCEWSSRHTNQVTPRLEYYVYCL